MTDGMEVHTLTIKRLVVTRDSVGGQVRTYTTAARGASPKTAKGRAIRMSPKEKLDHGVRGERTGWKFLIPDTNPEITTQDRIEFDYVEDESHTVKILVGSHARSAEASFYRCYGEEDTSET